MVRSFDQFGSCSLMSSFVMSSKLNIFVLFYYLLQLNSFFLHSRYLISCLLCTYVFIVSTDCILLTSFEVKAVLLISSLKTCISFLTFCCVFNISSIFFMNSFLSSLRLHQFHFFLNGLFYFQFELLLYSFYNLEIKFSFYDSLFAPFPFFYLDHWFLLNSYMS